MTNLLNFRLKINLSKVYNDQRKLSYVYIDTDKITNLFQLHQKISNLFGISRSFHLFAEENIFLPLNEDIRIINKDDVITVQPDVSRSSQIQDQFLPDDFSSIKVSQTQKNVIKHKKKIVTPVFKVPSDTSSDDSDNGTNTDSKMDKSVDIEQNKNSEVLIISNISQKKRKRVRRKKTKTVEKELTQTNGNYTNTSNQLVNTQYNNTFTSTSTPKHLKFNWENEFNGEEEEEQKQQQMNENSIIKHSREPKPIIRSNEPADLSVLFSLRNHQVPPRFVSREILKKKEDLRKATSAKNNGSTMIEVTQIQADSSIKNCTDPMEENVDYSKVNPLEYPVHTLGFEVDDIVAFRTLKIGEDYSPTVSGNIIATTISKDCAQNNYTFKILEGHDQVKIPDGKFSLPSDEENECEDKKLDKNELITLHASQLVEPRLIHRLKIT